METSNTSGVQPVTVSETTITRKHHKYGPSKLNYLSECAAFKNHDGTSEAAEQGTFLHDLMEKMLKNVIAKKSATTLEQVDTWLKAGVELTEEELDYLRFACKRCDVFIARKPTQIITEIDVRVKNDQGVELNHGFLDVLYVFNDVGILIDFKFGWEPVKPANVNLQGKNYALGCFQMFRFLNRIGVEFVQPKLNWTTSAVFTRHEMSALYEELSTVITNAEYVQTYPDAAQKFMKVGPYCKYCAIAPTCSVLTNYRAAMVSKFQGLPMPTSFKGLELRTPEEIALARYWVDMVETCVGEVKERAFSVAEANGGSISCTLPNGEKVVYSIEEKNAARSLGSAIEVSEALKEFITPQEVLGAADLKITALEPIVKNAFVEHRALMGEKVTKKAAWEIVQSTLEAMGLLTRPDNKVRFLKLRKQVKQIEN